MEKSYPKEKKRFSIKKGVVLFVLVSGMIAFFYFDMGSLLTLSALKENKEALLSYSRSHYLFSVVLFILIYAAQPAG